MKDSIQCRNFYPICCIAYKSRVNALHLKGDFAGLLTVARGYQGVECSYNLLSYVSEKRRYMPRQCAANQRNMIIVVDESIVEHIFYLNELIAERRERLVSTKYY